MLVKILSMVLYFAIMFGVLIGGILLLKKYVFTKVRINKYIPLAVAVILFIIQFVLKENLPFWGGTAITIGAVLSFFWFWDIQQTGGPKATNEKKIVIKPKAKPNRVKNDK
ncbi:hypothetical protein ACQPU1_05810 [Clostridium paraputrificum]|uniref:hypothetical protein n=1 Tax=Clostridium TaxID=1485 RepID=UPI003D32A548